MCCGAAGAVLGVDEEEGEQEGGEEDGGEDNLGHAVSVFVKMVGGVRAIYTLFQSGSGASSSSKVALSVGEGNGVAASFAKPSSWCFRRRLAAGGEGGGLGGKNCFWWCSCAAAMVWKAWAVGKAQLSRTMEQHK